LASFAQYRPWVYPVKSCIYAKVKPKEAVHEVEQAESGGVRLASNVDVGRAKQGMPGFGERTKFSQD